MKEELSIDIIGLAGTCSYALDCIEAELVNIKNKHGKRVAYISICMAEYWKIQGDELQDLAMCALLHDNALTQYISEEQLYKKWGKALKLLSADPGYPSLQTHEIEPLSRRYGMKVWQSYLENKTSGAMRMYWVYGPDQKDITIIGLEPHPEDKKNGAYDRISLSDL